MENKITCRWHQLNYHPYKPTWIRRQIFRLCGESWDELVEITDASIFTDVTLDNRFLLKIFRSNVGLFVCHEIEYTDKEGFIVSTSDFKIEKYDEGIFELRFTKPIVEPMASKDVYLKVI